MVMNRNRAIALALMAPLALAAIPAALAQQTQADTGRAQAEAQRSQAEAQKALADAQRKLEEAAREVAELSMELHGPGSEEVRKIRIDGPGRAMLGINIGSAEPGTDGVRVVSVSPGGPAADAGVQAGDLVVAMDGKRVGSGRELVDNMREVKPGQKVALDLRRDGKTVKLSVEARASEDMIFISRMDPDGEAMRHMGGMPHFLLGPWGDAELVELTPALGRYFGTDKGLLVVKAPKAAGADIEEGDVIQSIGGREPQDAGHALRILGSYQPGETVDLVLLRQKKSRTVKITIPERPVMERRMIIMPPPAPGAPPAQPAPPAPPAPRGG
jgi:C-terminal processing protease CtpA/Prc